MPVKRRLTKDRQGYGDGHLHHYFFGHDFNGDGFGRENTPEVQAEMLAGWPLCREAVMELARKRAKRRGFTKIPSYWWIADSPELRDETITEDVQLARMGIDPTTLLFG